MKRTDLTIKDLSDDELERVRERSKNSQRDD